MIFVDSNIPMYLVGAPHPHKLGARRLLEAAISDGERLVTDAEVLQEILRRYTSIRRPDAIERAFDVLLGVVDDVWAVEVADVQRAKTILLGRSSLSARDAIHVATMERHRVPRILTFDAGFDGYPGITRLA